MALATLSIDLEAKLAKLEEGMRGAVRITEQSSRQMQASMDRLNQSARNFGSNLGSALAAYISIDFVRGVLKGVDAFNDLKDATGASIENISALEDVAVRTGTSFESVGTALVKFNKVLTEADKGSDNARIFKSLGLDAEKLKAIDPAEALRQTAVALSQFADDGNKARIVQELFGKSVREVAPFLKDLATQGSLIAKVTTEQAEAAERFNQQLDTLSKNSLDATRSLLNDFLPALNQVLASYIKLGGLKGTIAAVFGQDDMSQAAGKAKLLQDAVSLASNRIAAMSEELSRDPGNEFLKGRIDKARERLALLTSQAAQASDVLKKLANDIAPLAPDASNFSNEGRNRPRPGLAVAGKPVDTKGLTAEREKLARLLLEGEEQAQKDMTEAQIAQQDIRMASYKADLAARTEEMKQFLDNIDAERERHDDAQRAFADAVPTITKTALDQIDEFSKQAAANIQDTLGNAVEETLAGHFDNIGKLWKDMLLKMASQAIAANLARTILGDFGTTGKVGGLAGTFFDFLKNANGNAFGGSGVMPFASGGVFDSPHFFRFANGGAMAAGVLGEAGPEAVMPLRRGSDGKLGVAASGGGAQIFNFISGDTNVGQGASRGEVLAAVRQGQAETEMRMRRLMRNGNI